jgi:hypothetical protein
MKHHYMMKYSIIAYNDMVGKLNNGGTLPPVKKK